MARPPRGRGRKAPSAQLLFRIFIGRSGPGGQPVAVARAGGKGRGYGRPQRGRKSVRFSGRSRPLPAFFLFMAQHRKSLQATNPRWTVVQMAKRMGKMWHKLPQRERERYMDQADRMKSGRGAYRGRAMARRPMGRRGQGKKDLVVCFTTKAASLRNFLMSYL
ncbi:high mobility group protein B4 [Pseudopipra pipra]|uniref:high mobility group protein B4 n=1 Tax=Pseudopipra pipra TaxID=415032 RepID=UPI00313A41E7